MFEETYVDPESGETFAVGLKEWPSDPEIAGHGLGVKPTEVTCPGGVVNFVYPDEQKWVCWHCRKPIELRS